MHHIKPMGKGDPLCPLGFHPQVRWPTRCKRCFRDYKEHGNRNKEQDYKLKRNDTTASSPTLFSWSDKTAEDKIPYSDVTRRSWTSTSNLNENSRLNSESKPPKDVNSVDNTLAASSWTSTPDLVKLSDKTKPNGEIICVTLPRRRRPTQDTSSDDDYRRTAYTVRRRTMPSLLAKTPSTALEDGTNTTKPKSEKEIIADADESRSNIFMDAASSIHTDDTDTLVNDGLSEEQIESLKLELRNLRIRCEKAEKEKNDMLMRRVASLDSSASTKTTTSELSKLQEKINALTETCETLKDEKRLMSNRLHELESNSSKKSAKSGSSVEVEIESLKSKLQAAESLCEELMDENAEIKRELHDMEEEMEEMQDNFRENQADEYSSIKKELEQTGKNCRILSFKLRKSERKAEQLEAEKMESERKSREAIQKLQKELDELNEKLRLRSVEALDTKKKAPMLGNIPKTSSGEKVSRASLTRGGSQEDPVQLLRDLQDSFEREADLREQLKYAEEEAQNLRKKVSRVEDDNESLLMQLKKMATKAKSRKSSPTHSRYNNELSVEKDEGISDDDDPTELKLLLELNEQETAVLRKKVEELEENCDILKRKTSDLQGKLLIKEQKGTRTSRSKESKISEEDLQEVKNKLKDKENECDKLKLELSSLKKKKFSATKTISVDSDRDQENIDWQRQLKVVEQEASVLRARICSLEAENEKISNENKQLAIANLSKKTNLQTEADLKAKISSLEQQLDEVRKLKSKSDDGGSDEIKELKEKCVTLEAESARLSTNLRLLKEGTADEIKDFFQKRTPKIVTDSTPKSILKKMIEELECEIKDILTTQQKFFSDYKKRVAHGDELKRLTIELEEMKQKLEKLSKERKDEKGAWEKEKAKWSQEKRKFEIAEAKLVEAKQKEKETWENEKMKLMSEINELKSRVVNTDRELKSHIESNKNVAKIEVQLKSELAEKNKRIVELERKVHEIEEKSKKYERLVQVKKEKILNLYKEVEAMKKEQNNLNTKSQKTENDKIARVDKEQKEKIEELKQEIKKQNDEIQEKHRKIENLEILLSKDGTKCQITEIRNKFDAAQEELKILTEKLKTLEFEKEEIEEKAKVTSNDLEKQMNELKEKSEKLQANFESERTEVSQYKQEQAKKLLSKDTEIKSLKKKLSNMGDKKINDLKKDFDAKLEEMKNELASKQREYDELTSKYELLEDEHVTLKSQANLQKEQSQSQVLCIQKELTSVQNELKTLRETYNNRQDQWIKERLRLEDKIKDFENHASMSETHKLEYNKLKLLLEVKDSEFDQLQKTNQIHVDQMERLRKVNEELQRKLDDFDKVIKVQRNMVAESSSLESELRQLRAKLQNEEQGRKIEVAAIKVSYENHVETISNELKNLQTQLMRFKNERDMYKRLSENIQKAMPTKNTLSNSEQVEELQNQVATLEQQISCMEDQLSEARIEASRFKTELVSERSAWDVRLLEMTSKINELEEERLLHSGRTKSVGLKTRMELSWQREREDQNRLLQETSTLARDLRQTLFELERERDKERLEMKRRLDQMKKNAEEEQEESKKKLSELQFDLLELRDAHAKLRTTNEKLRREKERFDRERDLLRQSPRPNSAEIDQRHINYMLDLVQDLSKTVPIFPDQGLPPTPNKKQIALSRETSIERKNKSREGSLSKDESNFQFQQILQKLVDAAQQIKINQVNTIPLSGRDTVRKAFVSRRPASIDSDKMGENALGLQRRGSLYRKCVSLEHTSPAAESYGPIWRTDEDTDGSVNSFQLMEENYNSRVNYQFDPTFDSRLSSGSTHSEMSSSTMEKKKKKGLFGKLKKLAKSSRSVDNEIESVPTSYSSQVDPSSNSSFISESEPTSKKNFKGRITDLFRSTDSRSNSMERPTASHSNESLDMLKTTSNEKILLSQTLPRRTISSNDKIEKQTYSSSNSGAATMPRNVTKKTKN